MSQQLLKAFLFSFIVILSSSLSLMAQNSAEAFTAKNAAYVELAGNGIFYSLNYERIIHQKGVFKSAARVGFTAMPLKVGGDTYWSAALPLELIGLIGRNRHHLELGIGYTPYYYAVGKFEIGSSGEEFDRYRLTSLLPLRVGYRYQKPDGGFFFRIGYLPSMDFTPERTKLWVVTHGGISIGKSF